MLKPVTNPFDFAERLYYQLSAREAGNNVFLSPLSIQVALAMCAVGARGETRRVMAELIGAPESVDEQNRQYASLMKSINGEGKRPFELVMANALWGQQGYGFNLEFQKAVADFYDGALHQLDFVGQPDEAVETINDWIGNKTREKIKDLIPRDAINNDTRLILTNAIYFKGRWQQSFDNVLTRETNWYGPNYTYKVPTMHQSGSYLYFANKEFQALDLTYTGGQLAMLVVLPKRNNGLASLEAKWAARDMFQQVTQELSYEENVIVSLPRFKMESVFDLTSILRDISVQEIFSSTADFSGIRNEPLTISKFVHKANVEVNEEGTEAAAANVIMKCTCADPKPVTPKNFKADHPFLFFIRDIKTNVVLFSGRIIDPM